MEPHPYRQAFAARDLDRLVSLLGDEVTLHSPVISEPGFQGRDTVALMLGVALDVFTDNHFTRDFGDERSHVFVANARPLGKPIETTTLLEFDAHGKIREIWIMARPLTGVVALAEALGRRAQGAGRGVAMRAAAKPLAGLAALIDRAGARIAGDLNRRTNGMPKASKDDVHV